MARFGISEKSYQKLQAYFAQQTAVEKVLIYGSRAKGNARNGSDIDLSLIGADLTAQDLSRIRLELDELNTPYLFDLSLFSQLAVDFADEVNTTAKVFYQKPKSEQAVTLG